MLTPVATHYLAAIDRHRRRAPPPMSLRLLPICLVALLAGCTEPLVPRIDATDEMSLKNSLARITSSLTEERAEQFEIDLTTIMQAEVLPQGMYLPREPGRYRRVNMEKFQAVHGLTADDIHAKAKHIRRTIGEPQSEAGL